MSHRPTIHIAFGEIGAGKSHAARRFAYEQRIPFVEGDDFIPEAERPKFGRILPPKLEVVENFVKNHLLPGIEKFAAERPGQSFVVCQALYRAEHRAWLENQLQLISCPEPGNPYCRILRPYNVKFWLVEVPFLRHCRQILHRDGLRWLVYTLLNKLGFQKSGPQFELLSNPHDPDIK